MSRTLKNPKPVVRGPDGEINTIRLRVANIVKAAAELEAMAKTHDTLGAADFAEGLALDAHEPTRIFWSAVYDYLMRPDDWRRWQKQVFVDFPASRLLPRPSRGPQGDDDCPV